CARFRLARKQRATLKKLQDELQSAEARLAALEHCARFYYFTLTEVNIIL
ncbi:hypothetical protein MPER_10598, partial [Moniliophthora perniciosa FA553]